MVNPKASATRNPTPSATSRGSGSELRVDLSFVDLKSLHVSIVKTRLPLEFGFPSYRVQVPKRILILTVTHTIYIYIYM